MPTSPPETAEEIDDSSVDDYGNPGDNDWDCYEFAGEQPEEGEAVTPQIRMPPKPGGFSQHSNRYLDQLIQARGLKILQPRAVASAVWTQGFVPSLP